MPNVAVPIRTSIDWTCVRAAMHQCARFAADEHLAKAASHVSIAQGIMAKAHEPAQDIMAKAQEPIFTLKSFPGDARIKDATCLQGFLDSDTEVSRGSSDGAYATASRIRPSKAPRLR